MKEENIILDPGIGFGKDGNQNMEVLRRLDELVRAFPCPWLLGVSRKRFIGAILDLPAGERDEGTGAAGLWGINKDVQFSVSIMCLWRYGWQKSGMR